MIKQLCGIMIVFSILFIPFSVQANPQVSKEVEKEWFKRVRSPEGLKLIKEKGLDEGAMNIEEISAALIIEGYRISKADPAKATILFQSAKEFSPDYPPGYYASGKAYFKKSILNIFKTLDEFLSGWKATMRNFWWSFFTIGNLSITLIISILASFFIFAILMAVRYLPLLNHVIREKFPIIPPLLVKLIPVIVLLLVIILNPGYLYLYPLLLIVLWPYMSIKEKSVGLISLIILAIIPLVSPLFFSFLSAQKSPEIKAIVEINKGWIDDKSLRDFAESVNKGSKDPEAIFSLALAEKRRGNFAEALALYQRVLDVKPFTDRVYNNIGNVYSARKKFEDAISYYNKALEKNPNLVSPRYNLSQAYRETFRFEQGEKEYQEAIKMDPEILKGYSSVKGTSFNRLVVDEGLSKREIWKTALKKSEENDKLARSVWMRFMKGIRLEQIPYFFFVLFFVLLIYSFILKKESSVYECVKCGDVVCRKCYGKSNTENICSQCHQVLIQMDGSSQKRVEKILDVRKFQDKRKAILRFMTLFPGTAHIYTGHTIRGITFIFSVSFFFLWWFLWDYLKTPFKIYPAVLGPARLSFILSFIILYLILFMNGRKLSR